MSHRMHRSQRRKRRSRPADGFTLIEVLVVVSIIALLLAILLPSLKKAREQARITACMGNLHDFGLAIQQYTQEYDPYFPLVPYIGSTIWSQNPGADDNLFVLYLRKFTPNVGTYTCPATTHRVRTPKRIEKVPFKFGVRYDIYCDPDSSRVRNDFEFHGQLDQQVIQEPSVRVERVNGYGTSYEYSGWYSDKNSTSIPITWYPFSHNKKMTGQPLTIQRVKYPHDRILMKDADEGMSTGGNVVGAPPPPNGAQNNIPEPWDNHGKLASNALYADMHAASHPLSYWLKR